MSRLVRPLRLTEYRMPEAGRIRIGEKHGKAMRALTTFRFTSQHRTLIEELAKRYGGQPKRWHDDKANPPDQWEVYTTIDRLPVVVPPNVLSTWYELWSGGGRVRQCDGEQCEISSNDDMQSVPCICDRQQKLECRPYTRILVIPTEIAFHGVWLLQSKGWNVMHEMPGMAELIRTVANQQLTRAHLGIDQRQTRKNGKTSKFVVPTLTLDVTPLELASGASNLTSLNAVGPAASLALTSPSPSGPPPMPSVDDEVIDAEIIELTPLQARAYDCADEFGLDRLAFWNGLQLYTNHDDARINKGLTMLERGQLEPVGFSPEGKLITVKGPNA